MTPSKVATDKSNQNYFYLEPHPACNENMWLVQSPSASSNFKSHSSVGGQSLTIAEIKSRDGSASLMAGCSKQNFTGADASERDVFSQKLPFGTTLAAEGKQASSVIYSPLPAKIIYANNVDTSCMSYPFQAQSNGNRDRNVLPDTRYNSVKNYSEYQDHHVKDPKSLETIGASRGQMECLQPKNPTQGQRHDSHKEQPPAMSAWIQTPTGYLYPYQSTESATPVHVASTVQLGGFYKWPVAGGDAVLASTYGNMQWGMLPAYLLQSMQETRCHSGLVYGTEALHLSNNSTGNLSSPISRPVTPSAGSEEETPLQSEVSVAPSMFTSQQQPYQGCISPCIIASPSASQFPQIFQVMHTPSYINGADSKCQGMADTQVGMTKLRNIPAGVKSHPSFQPRYSPEFSEGSVQPSYAPNSSVMCTSPALISASAESKHTITENGGRSNSSLSIQSGAKQHCINTNNSIHHVGHVKRAFPEEEDQSSLLSGGQASMGIPSCCEALVPRQTPGKNISNGKHSFQTAEESSECGSQVTSLSEQPNDDKKLDDSISTKLPRKRKLNFELLVPWHIAISEQVAHFPSNSDALMQWAEASNRQCEKEENVLDNGVHGSNSSPMFVRAKRRLKMTTQLMQNVITPILADFMNSALLEDRECAVYTLAKFALGEACRLAGSRNRNIICPKCSSSIHDWHVEKVENEKICGAGILVEGFKRRIKHLNDDFLRLDKLASSASEIIRNAQDLERVSIETRFKMMEKNAAYKPMKPISEKCTAKMPRNFFQGIQLISL